MVGISPALGGVLMVRDISLAISTYCYIVVVLRKAINSSL